MADADHSVAFWQSVATTFSGDQGVAFDLYNEPYLYGSYFQNSAQDPWQCWLDGCGLNQYVTGGSPYTAQTSWQTAGMQQLVNAVRGTGAQNVIMVGGLNWARDLSGWLTHMPNDPVHNLAAAWHSYPSGNPSLLTECAAQWCWDQVVAPLATHVPIVVGETGDSSAGQLTYLPFFLPWADAHGVSYLAWTWNAWGDANDVLIQSWSGQPTAAEGAYYRQHLTSAVGGTTAAPTTPLPQLSSSPTPGVVTTPLSGTGGTASTSGENGAAGTSSGSAGPSGDTGTTSSSGGDHGTSTTSGDSGSSSTSGGESGGLLPTAGGNIGGFPCTVMMGGQAKTGVCTGTFVPIAAAAPTR
jgi:hypothetical protein